VNVSHSHEVHGSGTGSRLLVAFCLTVVILAVDAAVGFAANSLALLSDAGHILTDVFALGLAWLALKRSTRPADERNTYGYQRTGILAALANAVILIVIALFISVEAFGRVQHPQQVSGLPVILAALVALAVNTIIAYSLRSDGHENLNIRAALLHVIGDIGASVAVVVSGVIIVLTHAYVVDPILSWLIALLIAFGAWRIVSETVGILMEATPKDLDVAVIASAMREIPGVEGVHDLHVWALSDGLRLLSAHVQAPDQPLGSTAPLLADLRILLSRRFGIQHATIEVECEDCSLPTIRPITMQPDGLGARGTNRHDSR
jgi:cobalt-zinc-cadmium efflux system protein